MRHEFSKATKREAVKRAQGHCEAVGPLYGLDPGQRCDGDLGRGFEIDHYPIPATDEGSDTLGNAVVCCRACHRFKTSTYDVPMQAKSKRVSDKHIGIRPPSRWPSRPMGKGYRQHTATSPITKRVGQFGGEDA